MKVRFFTRFNSNPQNIFVRIYQSKDLDKTTKTGLIVPKDAFSNTYQKVKGKSNIKNKDAVNSKLEGLKAHLLDCYNDTIMNDSDFHKEWLRDRVDKYFNRVTSTDTYKKFLTLKPVRTPIISKSRALESLKLSLKLRLNIREISVSVK